MYKRLKQLCADRANNRGAHMSETALIIVLVSLVATPALTSVGKMPRKVSCAVLQADSSYSYYETDTGKCAIIERPMFPEDYWF